MGGRFSSRSRRGLERRKLSLIEWLRGPKFRHCSSEEAFNLLARCLREHGVPVARISGGFRTAHPQAAVVGIQWDEDAGCFVQRLSRAHVEEDKKKGSPFSELLAGLDQLRVRLDVDPDTLAYQLYRDLSAAGHVEYLGLAIVFDGLEETSVSSLHGELTNRVVISFSTKRSSGFSDDDVELLKVAVDAAIYRLESLSIRDALESLLEVYLGREAARHVLQGKFVRGSGETVNAAIWFCDLRGFTAMADREPPQKVVELLDQVFERVGLAVVEQGGTILKFIGDAMLAIFPDQCGRLESACRSALAAAKDAQERVSRFNRERQAAGEPAVGMGIAVHVGSVYFGNIGAAERLDFTVIGAAVNEVCRLEGLCKPLGQPILLSDRAAKELREGELIELSDHRLKGVGRSMTVFAPTPS